MMKNAIKSSIAFLLLMFFTCFLFVFIINTIAWNMEDRERLATPYERALLKYHGKNSTIYEQGGIYYLVRGGKTFKLKNKTFKLKKENLP